jgi:hypothetical protein
MPSFSSVRLIGRADCTKSKDALYDIGLPFGFATRLEPGVLRRPAVSDRAASRCVRRCDAAECKSPNSRSRLLRSQLMRDRGRQFNAEMERSVGGPEIDTRCFRMNKITKSLNGIRKHVRILGNKMSESICSLGRSCRSFAANAIRLQLHALASGTGACGSRFVCARLICSAAPSSPPHVGADKMRDKVGERVRFSRAFRRRPAVLIDRLRRERLP